MKKILVGGGSGFIGAYFCQMMQLAGWQVTTLSRTPGPNRITWKELKTRGLPECDTVVNMAGQQVLLLARQWNERYRNECINSRVDTAAALVDAVTAAENPPKVLISTSSTCFYGHSNDEEFDEYSPAGNSFPAQMVELGERAYDSLDTANVRYANVRIGLTFGPFTRHIIPLRMAHGGFLTKMKVPFLFGFGGRIASGKQILPWIHILDVCRLLHYIIDHEAMSGHYNAVIDDGVTNAEFTRMFSQVIRCPQLMNIPEKLLKAYIGPERLSMLTEGALIHPRRSREAGFQFQFTDMRSALEDLVIDESFAQRASWFIPGARHLVQQSTDGYKLNY